MSKKPQSYNFNDRHRRLLEALPRHDFKMTPAAIEAGFSENTARTGQKSLLKTALKRDVEIARQTGKKSIAEKLGLKNKDILREYRKLIEQDRDLGVKLKALQPPLKEQGIEFERDKASTEVPQVNITFIGVTTSTHTTHEDMAKIKEVKEVKESDPTEG